MRFTELLKDKKKLKIICILGIIGILLIGLTSIIPKQKNEIPSQTSEKAVEQYKAELEKEVLQLVTSIKGVGRAKVMITMKNGVEYVYAREEKQNTDTTNNTLTGDKTVQQRDNYEQTTIIIEDKNGRKTALLKTTIEPTVKGVVIVCEGGDDIIVEQKVIEAVKTALGIGSQKVCVTKLNADQ